MPGDSTKDGRGVPGWVRLTVFLTLFCRGWLYLRWDSPLRGIFWSEDWMTWPVDFFLHLDWDAYASTSDAYLTFLFRAIGILLMVAGVGAFFVRRGRTRGSDLLMVALCFSVLHAFAAWFEKDWQIGMLLELALQAWCPLLLWIGIRRGFGAPAFLRTARLLAALTFVGHGLYAIGHHPVPGSFVTMSIRVLGMSEDAAKLFLQVAGWLDSAVAILILTPWRRAILGAGIYMVAWGFVTALARVVSHYDPAVRFHGVDPWLFETLVRTAHWAIPLVVVILVFKPSTRSVAS